MKNTTTHLTALFTLLMVFTCTIQAQHDYRVKQRERPLIDLERIPESAYYQGKIRIKLAYPVEGISEDKEMSAEKSGFVVTGNPALDSLNSETGVNKISPLFGILYETKSASVANKSKHRDWGFNLWHELYLDPRMNIAETVKKYLSLEMIEIAEPEFKKQLVNHEQPDLFSEPSKSAGNNSGSKWTPNDPYYSHQWHYNNTGQQSGTPGADIRLQDAWDIEKGNSNVIVAVIDGGIDYAHEDLAANIWSGLGYNFVTNSTVISPQNHGTHVAGTVAALTNNSKGVAGIAGGSGTGNGVKLMSCQVFEGSNSGGFHLALIYAADNGASIAQNSWGYTTAGVYESAVLCAIDYFNENGGGNAMTGGLTIFAAGNNNSGGKWYPACYPGCIAVAATNNLDKKASYSNFDTWVDISAPGGDFAGAPERGVLSTLPSNSYGYYQGTSMACPHVSGVAALIASKAYGEFLATEIAEILLTTTDNHYAVNPLYLNKLGTGRLNAHAALVKTQSQLMQVGNPKNFLAAAMQPDQINLTWSLNAQNNDVLIVCSKNSQIGIPQNGQSYAIGETVAPGETVVYFGSQTAFQHTGLNAATNYFYRIYSFNAEYQYSTGRAAKASTSCQTQNLLPLTENFNSSQLLPICWEIVDHCNNGQVWKFGTFSGGMTGTSANYAYLNSDAYGSGNSQNCDLVTPLLDLSDYIAVTLSFKHYFSAYPASAGTLSYSLDNGVSWINLQVWTNSTANHTVFTQQIPALNGKPAVKIKWNYTGSWGYFWCIDDVAITGTPIVPKVNFTASKTSAAVRESLIFSDVSAGGNFTSWLWNFGESAQPETATGIGPHAVKYYTIGAKTISLSLNGSHTEIKSGFIQVHPVTQSVSATYNTGNIASDFLFTTLAGSSSCPGTLTLSIPQGVRISGVDVSYRMTALNNAWISEQRSQLRCITPGGTAEAQLHQVEEHRTGTQQYFRQGLSIANNVSGGGNIQFQIHAGRTWGGSGCNTSFNRVDNNSWTVTVHYYMPIALPPNGSQVVACASEAIEPSIPQIQDQCGEILVPTLTNIVDSPNPLICEGSRTYHYKYTDCTGHSENWSFTYMIQYQGFQLPMNGSANIQCANQLHTPEPPAVFDNCGYLPEPSGPTISEIPLCAGSVHYTWLYLDCAGNEAEWIYTFSIEDTEPPLLVGNLPGGNVGNLCVSEIPAAPGSNEIAGLYTDNCGSVSAYLTNTQVTGNDCGWTVTYSYTIEDACGNAAEEALVVFYGGNTTTPSLINPLIDAGSLDQHNLNWCLAQASAFDANTLESGVAALYHARCGEITALLTESIAGSNNTDCTWNYTFVYYVSDPCFNTVSCLVNFSGGDYQAPVLVNPNQGCSQLNQTGLNWSLAEIQSFDATTLENAVAALYSDNCTTPGAQLIQTEIAGNEEAWMAVFSFTISDQCGNLTQCEVVYSGNGMPEVPDFLTLETELIESGEYLCFNAYKTITVQNFTVEAGASTTLIAGQSIIFKPGTSVKTGAYLRAYISNDFCVNPTPLTSAGEAEPAMLNESNSDIPEDNLFTVFPNPTNGLLNIRVQDSPDATIFVEIFGMLGEKLAATQFSGHNQHTIDISNLSGGIYIVRAICKDRHSTMRIIKR